MQSPLPNMTTINLASKGDGEKLQMTPEEMKRFQECMKDPKFMDMWADYAKEISDPKHLKEQEEYLKQVEEEAKAAGDHSFTFIFPKPCFAVRSAAKDRFYINICDDEKVEEPVEETTGDRTASEWRVPISLGKLRDDVFHDKPCKVVDACYHPRATYLARQSERFMVFLVEIAVENINFNYHKEKKELPAPLPMEFERLADVAAVGNPTAQTIRIAAVKGKEGELVIEPKKKKEPAPDPKESFKGDDAFKKRLAASMGDAAAKEELRKAKEKKRREEEEARRREEEEAERKRAEEKKKEAEFARNLAVGLTGRAPQKNVPKFVVSEQCEVGYQDCFNESERPERRLPKALKVTIDLPKVPKASDLDMTIEPRALLLSSEKHSIEAAIPLQYEVDTEKAGAKFDKTKRVLTVTLAVVRRPSDFEKTFREEQEAKRREFREEARRQEEEERREREARERAEREAREKEEAERRAKEEERAAARREVEEKLKRIAEEEREKREKEEEKKMEEVRRKKEAELKKKMDALEASKASMAEVEQQRRAEAEKEHEKLMKKIKKEMEALKTAETMLQVSKRKQAELPFTNRFVFELD